MEQAIMFMNKQKVLGRLAAREVASTIQMETEQSGADDQAKALVRIVRDLNVPIMQAKFVLARLIKHLQASDLTINFIAFKFFNCAPRGSGYISQFQGGNKWGSDTYMTTRDTAEEAMFDYGGARARPANVPAAMLNRVRHLGQRADRKFEASVRPKYAALNYARLNSGSAGQWGRSCMVLKEHVKHNATFVHTDSFDVAGNDRTRAALGGQVATFLKMERLIANMSADMLRALHAAEQGHSYGDAIQVPGLGNTIYIEGHVHGEVRFERDIAKIVINCLELASAQTETAKLVAQGKPFKVMTPMQLREHYEDFARKYAIPVVYI
jgi:hypothetical protein